MSDEFFENVYTKLPIRGKRICIFEHGGHPAMISNKDTFSNKFFGKYRKVV